MSDGLGASSTAEKDPEVNEKKVIVPDEHFWKKSHRTSEYRAIILNKITDSQASY